MKDAGCGGGAGRWFGRLLPKWVVRHSSAADLGGGSARTIEPQKLVLQPRHFSLKHIATSKQTEKPSCVIGAKFLLSSTSTLRIGELDELHNLYGSLSILELHNVVDRKEALKANVREKKYVEMLSLKWSMWKSGNTFSGMGDSNDGIVWFEYWQLTIHEKDVQVTEASQGKASRNRKRSFEVQDVVDDISIKFGEVAMAIGRMVDSRLDVTKLYEEVMAMEGYEEEFLDDAFDYLVQSDTLAKAFMKKN
ncbi:hypothetical protein BC332_25997 [Capsicum chinense]|nr:hypothetical protein BC332_25997 [Capsicum chinense]